MTNPDFYMASSEGQLAAVHKCFKIKRLHLKDRDDLLLIHIEPPLSGIRYNISSEEIDNIMIATRHRGETLFPIAKWPVSVYVLVPLIDDPEKVDELKENEYKLIAWAEIYRTELAAISYEQH